MRKKILMMAAVLLALGLTACSNNDGQAANDAASTIQVESSAETEIANNIEEADRIVTNESVSNTTDETVEDNASE